MLHACLDTLSEAFSPSKEWNSWGTRWVCVFAERESGQIERYCMLAQNISYWQLHHKKHWLSETSISEILNRAFELVPDMGSFNFNWPAWQRRTEEEKREEKKSGDELKSKEGEKKTDRSCSQPDLLLRRICKKLSFSRAVWWTDWCWMAVCNPR